MAFVASPKYAQFVGMAIAVFAFGAVFIVLASYRAERIKIWLHPENYDKGYQTMQGLYAIGSGRTFWKRTWCQYAEAWVRTGSTE